MKIVVIGGSGLIGTKLVNRLRRGNHEVVAASLASGVNLLTGEGLTAALAGARVVVDVANSPSFEDRAALEFFETAGHHLLAAEKSAGVQHHLALSIVGLERLVESGYIRAKIAQESLIKASGIPYTILRSTQFYEFISSITEAAVEGNTVRLSPALFQPIAADDVAAVLAELALGSPLNSSIEVAGPEARPLDEFARQFLAARQDQRQVIADARVPYFGARIDGRSLIPSGGSRIGSTRFADWLSNSFPQPKPVSPATTKEHHR
jgi:uncharacterized protein YbjT (DUF2867 family)